MPRGTTQTGPRRPGAGVRTVSLVSLGCPKNLVDSEKMLGLLAEDGLIPVSADASAHADAVVINTCGFLEASRQESLAVIAEALEAKARGDVRRVVVAGCLVQRHRARLLEWAPGIDAMVGVFDRDMIVRAVRGRARRDALDADSPPYWIAGNALHAARQRGAQAVGLSVNGRDGRGVGYFEDDSARLRLTPRHYAYLRVGEGCNQACAFCTIPSIRGKMRSKPIDRAVSELRELLLDGAFEVSLIGQDTTSYGEDIGIGFDQPRRDSSAAAPGGLFGRGGLPALLKALSDEMDRTAAGGWLRLMYAYPSCFRDEFIDAFAQLSARGRLVPYIDIPLQHASDRILRAMRRRVTSARQVRLISRLRDRIPGIAIRTTFITGFPGEREEDHRILMDFVEATGFDAMGVFEFSPEPGTPAFRMHQDSALAVPPDVRSRRRHELMSLQQRIAFRRAADLAARFDPRAPMTTGARMDVLIDAPASLPSGSSPSLFRGRTTAQAPLIDSVTLVDSASPLSPGELVPCAVVASDGYDLVARPVRDLDRRHPLRVR
jgi:ribosomal protein S12 methylthiotransferase